jgi:arylsulfatase A-like enzyme
LARFGNSWVLTLLAAAAGAVLEARWAHAAATQSVSAVRSWLVSFGLLVPVALLVALGVTTLSPVLRPAPAAAQGARAGEPEQPNRRWADAVPWVAAALALLLALTAHLARGLLSLELSPASAAALLALGSWALARPLLGAALALKRQPWLDAATSRLPPFVLVALGALLFVGPIGWGMAHGTTNGDGGFWAIFGVLGRQGLDLRSMALLSGMACGAVLGALRPALGLVPLALVSAGALLVLGATSVRLLDDGALSLALERGAALSRHSLRMLRATTDRDGDGVSAHFGAHDCDDSRDDIYPGARETAGNGIDEDCSGADAALAVAAEPSSAPASKSAGDWILERLPRDLNLIFITVDTLRHDLGYTGYQRPISPNLDRLAAQSVVFDRAYSLASYTGKSIGPLLIGKYPSETHRGWLHFNRFGAEETFIQERLQAAGIRTLSVQGHWYFTPEYGLGRGFDVLDMSATPRKRQGEGDKTVNSDKLSDAAIAQLSNAENTRGRFFMWIHYLDPHAEYMRHAGFDFGSRGRDLYDSEVAFTDQQIGRVLDFVRASEFGSRTAIVVTSDHGEAFGEHGMYRHGFELWEALVRVPLIIYVPGAPPRRHDVRRGAIDLAPTLLSLFGVEALAGEQRLSGESLLHDVFMPPSHVPEPRPVFIDMSAGPYNEERQALIEDDIKLITSSGRALGLYDLDQDPREEQDRLDDAQLLGRARERFATFQSRLRLVRVKPP